MIYFMCFVLFSVGIYGILVKRNIIKLIISTMILNYAVYLFFVLVGYKHQGQAPVFEANNDISFMVDPLPQSMVMGAMIIGLAITALFVAIAMRLFKKFNTFDIYKMISEPKEKTD